MARQYLLVMALLVAALFSLNVAVEASGVVTFEVEIVSGYRLDSPNFLTFAPVGPGQVAQQDLEIVVYSNTEWSLEMKARNLGDADALADAIQFRDSGMWRALPHEKSTICAEQPATGQDGTVVNIPFRFQGGYEHDPGTYSILVEFTVVPTL